MKKNTFKIWSTIWAIIWALFAVGAWYAKIDLGTVATLGGIALMFVWMYEQENIQN